MMFGFIAVFFSHLWWQSLPSIYAIGLSVFVSLVLIAIRKLPIVTGALLGLIWAGGAGHYYLNWQLPHEFYNQNIIIEAKVSSIHLLPNVIPASQRTQNRPLLPSIKINLTLLTAGKTSLPLNPEVRLSWYKPEFWVQQGDIIQVLTNLKAPIGLANPNGFNYQTWLVSSNVVATGYIQSSLSNRLLLAKPSYRQRLINKIHQMPLDKGAEILSLSIGYRKLLSDKTWQAIQQTGTAHLFAISGLHLAIVFSFAYVMCRFLFAAATIALNVSCGYLIHINTRPLCLCVATFICAGYAFLSGFDVPVMRAVLSLGLISLLSVFGLYWRLTSIVLALLCAFIVMSPLSVLSVSFWFSFSAIAFIWFCLWLMPGAASNWREKVLKAVKLQVALSVLMMPIVAFSFSYLSAFSALINLVAVPFISLLVVPVCAVALVMLMLQQEHISESLFGVADRLLEVGLSSLIGITQFDFLGLEVIAMPLSVFCLALLAAMIFILPYWPQKLTTILLLCLPLGSYFLPQRLALWQINIMDVGHGLALVVYVDGDYLLYDTGARFVSGFSLAESVIKPYFDAIQVDNIEHLVLSHSDNDHAGGAAYIQKNFAVKHFHTTRSTCNRDSVLLNNTFFNKLKIEVFWPLKAIHNAKNNDSCVLKLTHVESQISVLLTGDIEAKTEKVLLEMHAKKEIDLRSSILIAPHHGSQTSSSQAFVLAVAAQHVVFSTKHRHRWNFPAQSVQTRFANTRATLHNTGTEGRIQFSIDNQIAFSRYRVDEYNRWYFKP